MAENMTNTTANEESVMTKDIFKKTFWRSFPLQACFCYERMQNVGFAYQMVPALKKLYPDKKEASEALKRHLAIFNTTPAMAHLITGADIAIEEELGIESEETVMAVKTGLMGPLAGVGDTLFIAIYRAIVFSIAAYIALQGNPVGLIVPPLTCCAVLWIRYKFTYIGYNSGRKLATSFADKLAPITDAASILGLTVVGALIPSVVKYSTDLTFAMGEVNFAAQDMLDKILPCMLPLGIVMLCYWLLGKKNVNSTRLIFILIALGMVLGNLQNIFTCVAGLF